MEGITGYLASVVTPQGAIAILAAVLFCGAGAWISRKRKFLPGRTVAAAVTGAALYGILSAVGFPIGPNTSFRIAIALLPVFGALFGPAAGFLVGFLGHGINDAFLYGGVWWSWVFLSAMMGFFGGLVRTDPSFDPLGGVCTKRHIKKMYLWMAAGMAAGSFCAYLGDICLYGEAPEKLFIQITLANGANFAVVAVLGIPAVALIAKIRREAGCQDKK